MALIRVCACWLAAAAALAATLEAGQDLDELLRRAGAYVTQFDAEFRNVVVEERYTQVSRRAGAIEPRIPSRELRSDFLFVKIPNDSHWLPFRDVYEVDGHPVRDRQERLSKLFIESAETAVQQATAIAAESARYNLGQVARNFNVPMFALVFLDPVNLGRSRFRFLSLDRKLGPGVRRVEFAETATPTLIRGTLDQDARASGTFWVDESSGQIIRTELVVNDHVVKATITTEYRRQTPFTVMIPAEMREVYVDGRTTIAGHATYTNVRRFAVTTSETLKQP